MLLVSLAARAENSCPTASAEQCATVFADRMSERLLSGPLKGGDFELESVVADGPNVILRHRASFEETAFTRFLSHYAISREQYLSTLREANASHSCLEPTRSIIELGGQIQNTFLFPDGTTLFEQTISSCPQG
jgi:hypothetical protein